MIISLWFLFLFVPSYNKVEEKLALKCEAFAVFADILYDSWSPAMTVSSICISILSMLSSSTVKVGLVPNQYLKKFSVSKFVILSVAYSGLVC